jgi:hypothetical protein
MITRITLILLFLLMMCVAGAGNPQSTPSTATFTPKDDKVQFPPAYVPSGRQMYRNIVRRAMAPPAKAAVPSRRRSANLCRT